MSSSSAVVFFSAFIIIYFAGLDTVKGISKVRLLCFLPLFQNLEKVQKRVARFVLGNCT